MKKILFLFFILGITTLRLNVSAQEFIKSDRIEVSWVIPEEFSSEQTVIGLKYKPDPEWHVYWKNPGDSGAAPKFNFISKTLKVGEVLWPYPQRLPLGDLVNLGYEGTVILPIDVQPINVFKKESFPKKIQNQAYSDNKSQTLELSAKLEWLVCSKDECLPGFATLRFSRPLTNVTKWDAHKEKDLKHFLSKVPLKKTEFPYKIVQLKKEDSYLSLILENPSSDKRLDVFPVDAEILSPHSPEIITEENKIIYKFKIQNLETDIKSQSFVITDHKKSWELENLDLKLEHQTISIHFYSLLILLAFAFLGGVILNFMPCVLPVLTIKFFSLAQVETKERLKESVLYTFGVLFTFTLLGVIFLILRALGNSVGWGFQLQSPIVVFILILLFWFMALNFLGVFELGSTIMNIAGKSQKTGAFATGVLSVFVAAPCTGPFMGTALGATATLPAYEALLIFIFLGLGLASPFILLGISSRVGRLIPPSGRWMETFKQFLAFPLLATVVWLLWVLHLQTGVDAIIVSLGSLLFLSFLLWLGLQFPKYKILFLGMSFLLVVFAAINLKTQAKSLMTNPSENTLWKRFNEEEIAKVRAENRPIFIDFTAAWCITCQVNKKVVLRTKYIEQLFNENKVTLFSADWTQQDPIISKALASYGRNSVPVYVYYAPGAQEPKILPQILTNSMIENLFN